MLHLLGFEYFTFSYFHISTLDTFQEYWRPGYKTVIRSKLYLIRLVLMCPELSCSVRRRLPNLSGWLVIDGSFYELCKILRVELSRVRGRRRVLVMILMNYYVFTTALCASYHPWVEQSLNSYILL